MGLVDVLVVKHAKVTGHVIRVLQTVLVPRVLMLVVHALMVVVGHALEPRNILVPDAVLILGVHGLLIKVITLTVVQ